MATRNNTDIVKGDELWLFIGETASTAPIAFATQHSLNRSLNTTSVSSKDHGNTSYVIPGEGSWTCSTEALYSVDGYTSVMDLFDAGELIYVTFGKIANYNAEGIVDNSNALWSMTPSTGTNVVWNGKGYITSLQASGGHGDSATFSIEITGVGPLTKATLPTPAQDSTPAANPA